MRRIALLARLALPRGAERFYLRRMRASGLFDAAFYRAENPDLHPLFRRRPDLHYIIAGEAEGRQPRADFVPSDYLRLNPDLGEWAARPFLHYVLHGHDEHRRTRDIPAPASGLTCALPVLRREGGREGEHGGGLGGRAQAEVAVVLHLHYRDLWDEFAEALAVAALEVDLFVTLSHRRGDLPDDPPPPPDRADAGDADPDEAPAAETLAAQIRASVPGARVIVMPNHGRDVFPFVHLVNSGLLDGYRAVCKLHTKRSPHRRDGDAWRRHLVAGVLPGAGTAAALERFLADPEAGLWVADGQHYTDPRWWGSNREGVARLCRRVGVLPDQGALSFPAGSIYWLKPAMITLIRGLRLRIEDFEPEAGQLDGTTAHAFERALGYLAAAAGLAIRQSAEVAAAPLPAAPALAAPAPNPAAPALPALVSAFYLPQFHRCPENDAWWGRGFTEWTAAARARPVLDGHDQPALPDELGFYDLARPEAMAEQAALAAEHGIDAFCVYHYWFGGKRLLERPMENLLARPDIAFPFYLCWANESWRRNWDGLSGEVLAGQDYAPGFEAALAADLARFMQDPRYLRPDGVRPRLVIYRPEDLPEPAANLARLRAAFRDLGVGEIELGAVRFHIAGENPVPEGAVDFWVEMPPHGLVGEHDYLFGGRDGNRLGFEPRPGFRGLIYDYARVVANSLSPAHAASLPANTIAGVMPSWDNTARRGLAAHLAYGAHPAAFSGWLHGLRASGRLAASYRGEVMVNAWNEWAERAVLEPCTTWGRAWLEVLRDWRAGVPAPASGGIVPAPASGGTMARPDAPASDAPAAEVPAAAPPEAAPAATG